MIKRLFYLGFFFKSCDWKKLKRQSDFVKTTYHISTTSQMRKMISVAYQYGISFHEFYYYGCYNKDAERIKEYASMSFMYEYEKKYNSNKYVDYLNDKLVFNEKYSEFVKRRWINPQKVSLGEIEDIIKDQTKIVLKRSKGSTGKDVLILDVNNMSGRELKELCLREKYNLMEEYVQQNIELQGLSPNSLNTCRIMTHLNEDGTVTILGALLRMGTSQNVDNFSQGGIAAQIDIHSGVLCRDAVSFDINQPIHIKHPVSQMDIKGFKMPYWNECIAMVKAAASKYPYNKTVGWDVAVRGDGPILIEGNHNWGARVWQMCEGKGMKAVLSKYMI